MFLNRKLLLSLVALVGACAGLSDEPGDPILEEDPVSVVTCFGEGCQGQGRRLLGAVFDDAGYFSVTTDATDGTNKAVTLAIDGNTLRGTRLKATPSGGVAYPDSNTAFVGMTMRAASGPARLTIAGVRTSKDGNLRLFDLRYSETGAGAGVNPCQHRSAIALSGHFDGIARHQASSNRLSFACVDEGIAYKCVNWNYPPGLAEGTLPWEAFQVCTRMGRGDYCKDGTAHTLDETTVRIWDTYDDLGFARRVDPFPALTVWPPPVTFIQVEAMWPGDDDLPAACLSKTRWQGLADGELSACSGTLQDPRKVQAADFCDNSFEVPTYAIVNESLYADTKLEEWAATGSDDVTSTVTGYFPGDPSYVQPKVPFGGGYEHENTLGTLFRSLPGSIAPEEAAAVWTYLGPDGDRVLGRPDSLSWGDILFEQVTPREGLVLLSEETMEGIAPVSMLYLYRKPNADANGDQYFNSTEPNLADAVLLDELGYIVGP